MRLMELVMGGAMSGVLLSLVGRFLDLVGLVHRSIAVVGALGGGAWARARARLWAGMVGFLVLLLG